MVSGLVTSPQDHQVRCPCSSRRSRSLESRGPRISSGEVMRIWMKSKLELLGSRPLRRSIIGSPSPLLLSVLGRAQGHLQSQGLELLHQHVEGLGDAGFRQVLPLHNGFVHAAAAVHVVRLDREDLLEGVRRAVRLDRKSTRLNSSHLVISYAVFCLKKKKIYLVCDFRSAP